MRSVGAVQGMGAKTALHRPRRRRRLNASEQRSGKPLTPRGHFQFKAELGKKERAPIFIGALWLPNEDLNPDKQSQSLSCCRYTIGQYLKCLIIIAALRQNVNRVFKFFLIFQKAIDKSRGNAL